MRPYIHWFSFLLLSILISHFFIGCSSVQKKNSNATERKIVIPFAEKHRGAHIFGYLDSINVRPFLQNNIEWITMVPYAVQDNYDSAELTHSPSDSAQLAHANENFKREITFAREMGLKVFIKPHVWIINDTIDKWRSDIFPTSEANWQECKKDYTDFILRWAEVATEAEAEMFCVGTEFTRLTKEKPEFWKSLIKDIRKVYPGKLSYAANWYQEYEHISFWEELDYIGVQAYFPLSKKENPSLEEVKEGWNKYLPTLEAVSQKNNRPILFTEMGYKSTSDAAVRPWTWMDYSDEADHRLSYETQDHCYQAFFDQVWNQEWFAGLHLWQMRSDFVKGRGKSDWDFTPQGKPAEGVINKGFNN